MMNKFGGNDDNTSTILTVVLVIIIVAILILLGFWGYTEYKKLDSQTSAKEAVNEFTTSVTEKNTTKNETTNTDYSNVVNPYDSIQTVSTNTVTTASNTVQTYKGFIMVGRIEIPKTKVDLPVLADVTSKSIEASVAVLYGPGLNQPGNTVIVGHNYRNGMFFSNNAKIQNGDTIYITDTTGNRISYKVYNTYVTTPEDAEYMTRDTKGATEISLSTCTDDSKGRIIIWARAE